MDRFNHLQVDADSNYAQIIENWRKKFLEMDQEEIQKKFPVEATPEAFYIEYYSHKLRVDRTTGVISYAEEPDRPVGFGPAMAVYNSFYYAIDAPVASGMLVPFRKVRRVYPFEGAYRRTILKRFTRTFSGKTEQLDQACRALGGKKMQQGDVGYEIPVYGDLKIAVLFWDGDEEFEAQGNLLFDSNITDFMHEENVVTVADDAIDYLIEEAGL